MSRLRRPWRYWEIFLVIIRIKPRAIMEIGTWTGDRALTMIRLASRSRRPEDIAYYGFDLFGQMTTARFAEEKSKWPPTQQEADAKLRKTGADIHLFQGDTMQTLPALIDSLPQMDMIFIDGGHSLETIANDWRWASRLMHDRTVVVFDDYWIGRADAGCKTLIDGLDRSRYSVKLGYFRDAFKKTAFGPLHIRLAFVQKRSSDYLQ